MSTINTRLPEPFAARTGAAAVTSSSKDFPPDCCFGADTAKSADGFLFSV